MNLIATHTSGVNNLLNHPINADYIIRLEAFDYECSDGDHWYSINFHMIDGLARWYYPDKLTRDNRYAEVKAYLDVTSF